MFYDFNLTLFKLMHGQSSYWTAKPSFVSLKIDQTWVDPNYTPVWIFWTMIFYNLKKFRSRSQACNIYLMWGQTLF